MAKKPTPKKPARSSRRKPDAALSDVTPEDAAAPAPEEPAWHEHLKRVRTFVEPAPEAAPAHADDAPKAIPADTIRRLKYPVIETIHADGSRSYKHDRGIVDDARISTGLRQ